MKVTVLGSIWLSKYVHCVEVTAFGMQWLRCISFSYHYSKFSSQNIFEHKKIKCKSWHPSKKCFAAYSPNLLMLFPTLSSAIIQHTFIFIHDQQLFNKPFRILWHLLMSFCSNNSNPLLKFIRSGLHSLLALLR